MSGAEGIENEDVTIGSELLGDLGIVLLLTLIEADVLENENLARLDGGDSLGSLLAVGVGDKGNVKTRELGELLGDRLEDSSGWKPVPSGRPRWLMRMTRALCSTR